MTDLEYKMDLEYLYFTLQKHPLLLTNEYKRMCFEQLYLNQKNKKYDYESFINTATELTTFFQDGHTNIEIPYMSKDRCLRLKCCWSEKDNNAFILMEQYDDIPQKSKIIAIEDITLKNPKYFPKMPISISLINQKINHSII